MSKKKVLVIGLDENLFSKKSTDSYERQKDYAKHFEKMTILVYSKKKFAPIKDKALRIYATHSKHLILGFFDLFFLGRAQLRKEKYDSISSQDPFFLGFIAYLLSRIYKIPFYPQLHIEAFSNPYWREESLLNRLQYYCGLFVIKRADKVRVVSRRSEKYMKRKQIPFEFIPVSTDFKKFSIQTNKQKEYDLIFVGRMVPQKNPFFFLELVSELKKTRETLKVLCIGEGELLKKVKQRAKELKLSKSITFKNSVQHSELLELMNLSKVFVLPSTYEGWGLVCIEASLCGIPVVMTRTGCADEIIIDSKSGSVCEINDKKDFLKKIENYLNDSKLREEHALEARKLSQKRLNQEKLRKKWVDFLYGK